MRYTDFLHRSGVHRERYSVYRQRGQLPFTPPDPRSPNYTEEDADRLSIMARLCDAGLKVETARRLAMNDGDAAEQVLGLLLSVAPLPDTMKAPDLHEVSPGFWV